MNTQTHTHFSYLVVFSVFVVPIITYFDFQEKLIYLQLPNDPKEKTKEGNKNKINKHK
jgi:hypothetical protein